MIYKAKNIDTNKFLEALKIKQDNASYNHLMNFKIEEARYNQERETLAQIENMFYCSNYEKGEDDTDDEMVITKQQYNDYQTLLNNFDYAVDSKIEIELKNWQEEALRKLISYLKSEDHLIYGADKKKKICNVNYEELNKILAFAFACEVEDILKLEENKNE